MGHCKCLSSRCLNGLNGIQLTLTRSSEMEIVERLALPVLKPLLKLLVMGSEKMGMLWICSGS